MKKIIIIIIALMIFVPNTYSKPKTVKPVAAWIKLFVNKVEIQPGGKGKWYKAIIGMALKPKDVIKTYKKSWVNIAYENSSIIRIAQNSTVEISKLNYDVKKKAIQTETKISMMGKIIATLRKLKKDKNSYNFYTPVAVIGVRGTDIMVDVKDKDTSYVVVFEGELIVKDFVTETGISMDDTEMMLDLLRETVVGGNQMIEYKKGKMSSKKKDISKLYNNEKKIVKQLKEDSRKLAEKISKENQEDRWSSALKLREQSIKK